MNKTLTTIFALAIASAAMFAQAQDAKGDVMQGEKKASMCIGCHGIVGYQASFPEVYKVPKISGQNAPYIVSALNAYKTGERKHPTMRGIAESLSEQDMADLAAFYGQHGVKAGVVVAPVVETNAAGETKYLVSDRFAELLKKGNCTACHGANLNTPVAPNQPKIAGQYADYLYASLKAYKTLDNPKIGRNNAIMGAQVKAFTPAELRELAHFIGQRDGDLRSVPQSRFR